MKKFLYLFVVAIVIISCKPGAYIPHATNHFGAQTQVVLNQANFRVVRNIEVVVEVNNTNLRRAEAENSAYGELLREANLTGSQVLINVVFEEIIRGEYERQYIAARATIIEFLDENGNPTVSQSYRPSNAQPVNETKNSVKKEENNNSQTNSSTSITGEENVKKEHKMILEGLNTFGWQNSLLYKSYEKAFNYLIENNKIDDAKKVNRVLQDVLDNKIYKSTVEKQLKTNAEKGIPEYQTFMKF